MKIISSHLGELEFDPEKVIHFMNGLPGFESCHQFKLFHEEKNNPVIWWLQCVDQPEVMFNLVDPALLGVQYEILLQENEVEQLSFEENDEVIALLMVSRPLDNNNSIQFQAKQPIILNVSKKMGIQKTGLQPNLVFR